MIFHPATYGQISALMGQPLHTLPLVFLDVETTGLGLMEGHRVCEVALLRTVGDTIVVSYESLINPGREVEPDAYQVNHISPEMLAAAPPFAAVADEIAAVVQDAIIVAHHAAFDVAFLRNEFALLDRPISHNAALDTLALSRRLLRQGSHGLHALAAGLNLPQPTHRAMADVLAMRGLFTHLLHLLHEREIFTLYDMLRFERGLLPGEPEPTPPPLIQQALHEQCKLRIVYRSRSTPKPIERIIQPLDLVRARKGVHLRAYCHLRNDVRTFVITKIEAMELIDELG